jgi:hypothetical protein
LVLRSVGCLTGYTVTKKVVSLCVFVRRFTVAVTDQSPDARIFGRDCGSGARFC